MQILPLLRKWIGPLPGGREARAMGAMATIAGFILCALGIYYGFRGEMFMGRPLGGDFAGFYTPGKILNNYEPWRIYDLDLEVKIQHGPDVGTQSTDMLPYAHGPWMVQILRIFALLPYRWAFVAWLVFSMALYVTGLKLLLQVARLTPEQRTTGFLMGMGSMAFIIETWIGGQMSVALFFVTALFTYFRFRGREDLAGGVLSIALYKPTLVAIPVFMMLCGRQWRLLRGFVIGAILMACAAVATVGVKGCLAWYDRMRFFRSLATGALGALRRTKYVDVGSFFHLIFGESPIAQVLGIAAAVAGVAFLALAWWRSGNASAESKDLLWAATIAGSLVFNVYSPIYDTTLMAASAALTAGVLLQRAGEARDEFCAWLLMLYMVPWLTQSSAEFLRFQPFTLILAGFVYWAVKQASANHTLQRAAGSGV